MTEGEKSCPVCQHMLSESKEISPHPSSSFAVSLPSLPLLHRVCMDTGPGSSPLKVEGRAEPWLYPASGWSHCASSLLPSLLSPQIWAPSYTAHKGRTTSSFFSIVLGGINYSRCTPFWLCLIKRSLWINSREIKSHYFTVAK